MASALPIGGNEDFGTSPFFCSPRTWEAETQGQAVATNRLQDFFMPSGHELRMTASGTHRTFQDCPLYERFRGQRGRWARNAEGPRLTDSPAHGEARSEIGEAAGNHDTDPTQPNRDTEIAGSRPSATSAVAMAVK
jgi:hypothetical protein